MRKILHHAHGMVFAVLFFSGFLLHFSILRGPLSSYRLLLMKTHSYAGEFFSVLLVSYGLFFLMRRPVGWKRKKYRQSVGIAFLVLAVWVSSGWILLQKAAWGSVFTYYSFELHRWLAYGSAPAVLWHAWAVWRKPLTDSLSGTRRRFLGWLAAGVGGAWIISLIWRGYAGNRPQDVKGNANCDVFFPAPEPAKDSLPPIGGGMLGKFGEYSVMNFLPCLHQDTWRFTIDGLVNRTVTFRWEDFVRLPRKVQVSHFHCVEGWSVLNITYEGLMVSDLLSMVGVRPEAKFVKFYSADGEYADALSLEQAHMQDVMIVMLMDGKPITRVLGGPARLIIPQMYAYKAVKWVTRIELIDKPYLGYWEYQGHFETDAWVGIY